MEASRLQGFVKDLETFFDTLCREHPDTKPKLDEFLQVSGTGSSSCPCLSMPLLRDFLPGDYYAHYSLLASAMFMLLQPTVTELEVEMAHEMLIVFYKEFGGLHGDREYTINVHSVLHLAEQVKTFGPLRTHSGFPFEGNLHLLKEQVHGTRAVNEQVMTAITLQKEVEEGCKLAQSERVTDFVNDMLQTNGKRSVKSIELLPPAMLRDGRRIYARMEKDGVVYHSTEYRYGRKTGEGTTSNSYTIGYQDVSGETCYGTVEFYFSEGRNVCASVMKLDDVNVEITKDLPVNNAKFLEFVENRFLGRHYRAVRETNIRTIVNAENVLFRGIVVCNSVGMFVARHFGEVGVY